MRPALVAALLLVAVPAVAGHAEYQSSEPPQGAQLRAAPAEVLVRFTERVELQGTSIEVVDAMGKRVDDGHVQVVADPPSARVGLAPLGEGGYLVQWRTLSGADGHPMLGSFGFAVGNATAPGTTTGDLQTSPASMAVRILAMLAWAIPFGAILAALVLGMPEPPRRMTAGLLAASVLGVGLLLAWTVQAAEVPWRDALRTRTGQFQSLRILATIAAASLLRWRWASLAMLAAAAYFGVMVSHPSNSGPLAIGAAWFHVLAAGAWAGGLAALANAARTPRGPEFGMRFGRLALPAVCVLGVTGLIEAAMLTHMSLPVIGWTASGYGRLLLAKTLLFAAMLGLAALARFILLRRPGAQPRLRRSVTVEFATGAFVIAIAGVLASTSPPVPTAQEVAIHVEGDAYAYDVLIGPVPRVGGGAHMQVRITDAHGSPVVQDSCGRPSCLTIKVTAPGAYGPQTLQAVYAGDHRYISLLWTHPGSWRVDLEYSSADVFRDRATFDVEVPG